MIRRYSILGLITAGVLALALFFVACGGGSPGTINKGTAAATINLSLSDPAPCSVASSTGGIYKSVFIAISDVEINANATAGDNDPNWLDLTPSLKNSGIPIQVDLLKQPDPQCFLANLGSTTAIPPGTYQQIRIKLADNTATNANALGNNNGCLRTTTPSVNCVILPDDTVHPLLLSSEVKTGIKIPSGQIAGGKFTIAAGETKDLDIDIDSCGSVVVVVAQGNSQFRLKPVLHAGEVSLASNSINGKLVDAGGNAIGGIKAIVALEERHGANPNTIRMQTTTDASGNFNLCPVPDGTYDLVAVVVASNSNNAFAATITTGVTPGKNVGNVVMNAVSGGTSTAPARLHGDVTTAGASGGIEEHVVVSALQQVALTSPTATNVPFIIPAGTQSAQVTLDTSKPASCTSPTCPSFSATYDLTVPPANPTVGAFVAGATTAYAAGSGSASYTVQADAFLPITTPTPTCSPTTQISTPAVTVSAGTTSPVSTLNFVGCTAAPTP